MQPNEDQEHAYAVVTQFGATETTERSELGSRAEDLQREGKVVRIVHVVGANRYEVDSYPPR